MNTMTGPKIQIYTADTSALHEKMLYKNAYASVSETRRRKVDRLRSEQDKCRSLGAGYLLLCACADFGISYENAQIVTDEFSKPRFADLPLFFSLSHSGARAMCIMAQAPVGCDVEQRRPVEPALAKRFFSEAENRALDSCAAPEDREALFFKLWTLKESFLKCTGRGLRLPLNAFSVSVGQSGIQITQSVDDAQYRLFAEDFGDGYQYAWCIRDAEGSLQFSESTALWCSVDLQRILR